MSPRVTAPSPRPAFFLALVLSAALLCACATVKASHLREDYEQVDKQRVKRLLVVSAPIPEGGPKVAELFSLIARRDINLKRNFLVKDGVAASELGPVKDRCGEGYEGVLHLEPTLHREDAKVAAGLKARLLRCVDG